MKKNSRSGINRRKFLGTSAAGVAGAAMMGAGVARANGPDVEEPDPSTVAGMWISNFALTTDSSGTKYEEGFIMKLGADKSVVLIASQFQLGISGGREVKTSRIGTWEWHDTDDYSSIRLMLFDLYNSNFSSSNNAHISLMLGAWDAQVDKKTQTVNPRGWSEYDRETRVLKIKSKDAYENVTKFKQTKETIVGVFGDQVEKKLDYETEETNPATGDPLDINNPLGGNLGSGLAFNRGKVNPETLIFKRMPNFADDLKKLKDQEYSP